ncbi:MAG: GlsB/YeaQ/YmgE family stress response membrane protein [Actinomycetota bacterium]|nr:GlsB/YeaQ/YmgE family stress response membrane protein [Actinomycetota bacterium]
MGILGWILFGLLAGALARALTPGRHQIGCFGTLAVGVVGALIGGFLGEAVFGTEIDFGWDLKPFLLAVAGSIVLLLGLNALRRR